MLKEVPHPHFREHTRAPLKAPVNLQFESWGEAQEGFTANVSLGGMFVHAQEPKPVGTYLRFEIQLPGAGSPVCGLGEVVWLRSKSDGREYPSGMGIQFRHFKDNEYERLERLVEALLVSLDFPTPPNLSQEEIESLRSPSDPETEPEDPPAPTETPDPD